MKVSMKLLIVTLIAGMVVCTFAQEDEDDVVVDEVEVDDEAEIEEEPVDEVKVKEEATGIVDPSNYPGRVISRKKILTKNPAAGNAIEFEYTIYNVGNTDISDITVTDDTYLDEDWTEAKKIEFQVKSIPAGGKYSETHTMTPKSDGKIKLAGAKVTYKSLISADSDDVVIYTSEGANEGVVPIDTAANYARHVQSHLFDWVCFGMLAVPSTVLPYLAAQNTLTRYGKAKTA